MKRTTRKCGWAERRHSRILCVVSLLISVPIVTAACALLMLALNAAILRGTPIVEPCCEAEAALLSHIVNHSVDPCRFAFDFACNRYSASRAPGALLDAEVIPMAYWPSNAPATRLIHEYLQSCIDTTANVRRMGAEAATSLLQFLNPGVKNSLRIVVAVGLKYNVRFPVMFVSESSEQLWPTGIPSRTFFNSYHVAVYLDPYQPSADILPDYLQMQRDALDAVNKALSVNVSEGEVENMRTSLATNDSLNSFVQADLKALQQFEPSFQPTQWKNLLENLSGGRLTGVVYHSANVENLKRSFDILLNATSQPQAVVFSVVEAALGLLAPVLEAKWKRTYTTPDIYCRERVRGLGPLVVLGKLEALNAGEVHDIALRNMFRRITAAAAERATTIAVPRDADSVRKSVKKTQLRLPNEVLRLDLPLPNFTGSYTHNYLELQGSGWAMDKIDVSPDVPRTVVTSGIWSAKASVFDGVVVLPVKAYAAVNITPAVDGVVTMASIGMLMADAIWRNVFTYNWSGGTRRAFDRHGKCEGTGGRVEPRFHHLQLSLDVTLDAARDRLWQGKFRSRLKKTSRSRLFFLLLLFHFYCPRPERSLEADDLLHRSDDFSMAFGCEQRTIYDDLQC